MKQCPKCGTTYTDDSLQFCLTDGANLTSTSSAAETVQMSFGNEPMRVNIPQNSAPTVFSAPPSQTAASQPTKKIAGIIVVCIALFFLLLAGVGIAGFIFYKQSGGGDNAAISASPTPSIKPSVSPTVSSNDELEKLKRETANLKKQIEDQKNQTSNSSSNPPYNPPPKETQTTARANSPRDGFLALRSEPNSETGYRVAQIPHGATLTVLGCPKPSNVGKMPGRWCQVVYNGQSGWAFDAFMKF